jgi:site-specific DNA-cytosine methylase
MQSENKNDSVQLSTRYQQYDFAKRHLGGFGGRQVFPIGESSTENISERFVGSEEIPSMELQSQTKFGEPARQGIQKGNDITINSKLRNGQIPHIRRLTPTECERLMGLPDGWTEGVSDTQRYKLCGNGVVVNVVQEIIKRLYEKR